ncbi:hypothetical protein H0H93_014292 [Arthromyces matolae]|nr:hypothetical protein H0H93_014292 [Arthromyces matolae]
MEKDLHREFALHVYQKQNFSDNTLDDAQLETRCPLDNGRHDCTSIPTRFSVGHLDRFPLELISEVLLHLDIPSLTRFRVLNRRTMELVNSIRQYTAIIQHCPNIIRAIVSIQADAFDCGTLFRTLCTIQCSTCNRFGDHLYLIDCRRVCYFCFTMRPEYLPLTTREASRLLTLSAMPHAESGIKSSRKLLALSNPPSILSLPGRYCCVKRDGILQRKRIQLYDRQTLVQSLTGDGLPRQDKFTGEPKRFMAIITAPILLNGGRQVDYGLFCLGCWDETAEETKHFRIKYPTPGISEHIAKYGPIVEKDMPTIPPRFKHLSKDQIMP